MWQDLFCFCPISTADLCLVAAVHIWLVAATEIGPVFPESICSVSTTDLGLGTLDQTG